MRDIKNCVYIISDGSGYLKIGVAASLEKRVKQLQTGNPNELKVIGVIRCANRTEAGQMEARGTNGTQSHIQLSYSRSGRAVQRSISLHRLPAGCSGKENA